MSDRNAPSPLDPELEAEIAAALGDESIDAMLEAASVPPPSAKPAPKPERAATGKGRRGADEAEPRTRSGQVVAIHGGNVMVEFSAKEQGLCPVEQFGEDEPPQLGESLEFIVTGEVEPGLLQLSRRGKVVKVNWDAVAPDMIVEATVTGHNKGGLELTIAHHAAFMPVSQIDTRRVEDLEPYVGTKLRCQVVELDKQKGRVILSRRNVLAVEQAQEKQRLLNELQPGEMLDGVVRRVEKFGAFVEIAPGVDGLVHVSDMSWQRIDDPKTVVQPGQPVRVQVLKVDPETERIALGLKQTMSDPWSAIETRYSVGATVIGRVTRTAAFGAFVELEPGVEGLIHIGQLSEKRVDRVESVVKANQSVTVKVTEVDPTRRRIGLSMKAVKATETGEVPSADDLRRYLRDESKPGQARAMESLMAKFGGGGLKGGIG